MKIAVFLPNWIGDVVMATPALRAIRTEFPQAEIVGVLRPYVADVLDGLDLIDRRIVGDPKRQQRDKSRGSSSAGRPLAAQLRREKFDVAVLFPNSLRSAVMARLSGAKRRIGFRRNLRGWLLTDAVTPKTRTQPHPVMDEYLRLAEHLGCRTTSRRMELAVLPIDELRLHNFWQRAGRHLRSNGYVCLNPGGAFGAAKHWPAEYFAELARRIAVVLKKTVLILCGPAERATARLIARSARHHAVVSLADEQPSLGLTKAAVQGADLLVATDSGPRHFAPPFKVPVITLFGPTHPEWSETYYDKATHLQHEVDCGPCQQRVCPLKHHRCMRELTVDRVFAAVERCLLQPVEQPLSA